jgi:hypothetical protein
MLCGGMVVNMKFIIKILIICLLFMPVQSAFAASLQENNTQTNTERLLDGEAYLDDLLAESGGILDGNTVTVKDISKTFTIRYVNNKAVVNVKEFSQAFNPQSTIEYYKKVQSIMDPGGSTLINCSSGPRLARASQVQIYTATYGQEGQNIRNIQEALKKADCWVNTDGTPSDVGITGYFGDITKASMIKFQKEQMGLEDSDIYYDDGTYCGCGPKTAAALTQVLAETWVDKYGGVFQNTDFDLNPEVIQMLSYYDDLYIQSGYAYEIGILEGWGYKALKDFCKQECKKLREANKINTKEKSYAWDVVCTIGAFMPYAGFIFDFAGNASTVYAASLSDAAICTVESPNNYAKISEAMIRNLKFKHTVYELYDEATGEVRYVGRTRQALILRQRQHWYTDIKKKGLSIRVASYEGKLLENLDYREARGLEYRLFEKYEKFYGGYNCSRFLNKIKPLNISKSKAIEYLEAATKFLKKAL